MEAVTPLLLPLAAWHDAKPQAALDAEGTRMAVANPWPDAQRIESWAGEVRVNLIRLIALVVFYGHHLINVYLIQDDPSLRGDYHTGVTALVMAWSIAVLALYICLSRRWVPPALKYLATAWDIILITALVNLTRDPKTMQTSLYFLVISAAGLRLSLPLVYTATLGSMAAYAFFLGYVRFWWELPETERLSRPNQVIFLLALGTAGILTGQLVRQARRLLGGYPVTVVKSKE
jgi:hypothetical protein